MKTLKIFLLFFISAYLFVVPTVTYAMPNPSVQKDDLIFDFEDSMSEISDSIKSLGDIDPKVASSFASNFEAVMKYAGYVGTTLGLINGSVAFLKLIGVMKDSTEQKLINISDQLDNINDKMTEMDGKLNNITAEMAKIEASIEFHARDQKADYLMGKWKDFVYQYMESSLDKSMVDYQSMILNGVKNWCNNTTADARKTDDIDNSQIILLYKKNAAGDYDLQYTLDNEVPRGFPEDGKYIILKQGVMPENVGWDVEQYVTKLESYIYSNIANNITNRNFSVFETQNYPFLTPEGAPKYIDQGPKLEIQKIAQDAVSVLMYRIAAAEVNKDAKFSKTLAQQFTNYTNHLLSSEEGIDAMFKTFYLTHAFESEVRSDLIDFANRMTVKSGTYGLFVMNVLGMSNSITDSEKTTVIEQINKIIKTIKSAKENGITGIDNFSYITNTKLHLTDAYFESEATLAVRVGPGNRRAYKGFSSKGISSLKTDRDFGENYSVIGDTNLMLVLNTMQANGISGDFDSLNKYMPGSENNRDAVITSYTAPQDMSLDGTIPCNTKNISGDYFDPGTGKNSLPSDASNEYVKIKQKVTGSTYIPSTGQLQTGRNLIALGAYAEDHTLWAIDETAFFGGPSNYKKYSDRVDQVATVSEYVELNADGTINETPTVTDGVPNATVYNFIYQGNASYNTIVSVPLPDKEGPASNLLKADNEETYNPLISYRNMDMSVDKKADANTNNGIDLKELAVLIAIGVAGLITALCFLIHGKKTKKA